MGNKICYSCVISKSLPCSICNYESIHESLQLSLSNDFGEIHRPEGFKSSMKYIDSYNAYNNFFYLLSQIIYIQKAYKRHLNERLILKKITNSFFLLQKKVYSEENEKLVVNIEEKVSRKRSNISMYSNSITMLSEGPSLGLIKGYFLKNRKKYKYKGSLQGKKKEGYGKVTWEDGSILNAHFTNSKAEGICRYIDSNGMEFIGQYANNRPLGYGIFKQGDEVTYEGYWHNNILTGIGVEVWKDQTIYHGDIVNSKKQGIGLYRWPDGTIYQGNWDNDKMSGIGIIFYSDERIYSGEVYNGYIHGFGEFTWPDRKKYIGYYKKEKKEGFGLFVWSIQPFIAFIGFWQNGRQNGIGAKINGTQIKFGIWKDGKNDTWLNYSWEILKFMKKNQEKYYSFFQQNAELLQKTIKSFVV